MKNNKLIGFAIVLIAVFIFTGTAATAHAQESPEDFNDSPCGRFPAESVFDSFAKALQTPEKVRCLAPKFEGTDLNMKRLPVGLGKFVNLEVFAFACLEQLEALPEEIGNLRKLEEMIIDNGNGCGMNLRLPRSIGKLENLRVLRLYGALDARDSGRLRNVKSLPDTLGDLRKLEVLDLGRNGLTAVPPAIARLSNLKTLRLEYNDLRALPAFVGNLSNLQEISLDSNGRAVVLPASLSKLKRLKISMGNNSLKLKDQKSLRTRFPKVVFAFENEFDDSSANQESR